jgi:hypothetical protein
MCLQAVSALAENYEVNLTRKGSNVYKIDGKEIIIQTRYCASRLMLMRRFRRRWSG